MAQICVSDLTFGYEGSYDNVFEHVSFSIDTSWKLGFIGRNGKGKTTFLNLLLGKYEYEGSIKTPVKFDYFPYLFTEEQMERPAVELAEQFWPQHEFWKICRELDLMKTSAELLYRPFSTLSHGERTKVMLAVLFAGEHYFLLIDEPTNHLDMETREVVKDYLNGKSGFILVSHDRWLLDACVDHVLVFNRCSIQVEKGNFSSWWENKRRADAYQKTENEKLRREIRKMEQAAQRTAQWADKVESTKIGYDPVKRPDPDNRAFIGEKSRRMQQRRKNLERRQQQAVKEKQGLLKEIENPAELKIMPLNHHKEVYLTCRELGLSYGSQPVFWNFFLELKRGDRVILQGENGCGKSSFLKMILSYPGVQVLNRRRQNIRENGQKTGILQVADGLKISYVSQDTSFLKGSLDHYIEESGVSGSLFRAVLRQLDFERTQFGKQMEAYSEGQKKKVLLAESLLQQAHLYIWDEPLNYIDIFSRIQIEKLILEYRPTMLIVEHDVTFGEHIATKICGMDR